MDEMKNIDQRLAVMNGVLEALKESIEFYQEHSQITNQNPSLNNNRLLCVIRDSMICRFKYNVDLFWKILSLYMQDVHLLPL